MKKLVITLAIFIVATTGAYAGKLSDNTGCGVGSILFNSVGHANGGWLLQVTANWTNVALSNTFSMTTGTVGCKGSLNQVVSVEVYEFVNANMDDIARDSAQGRGETINSLAAMLNIADVEAYGTVLQANFSEIFPDAGVQSVDVANKLAALI